MPHSPPEGRCHFKLREWAVSLTGQGSGVLTGYEFDWADLPMTF